MSGSDQQVGAPVSVYRTESRALDSHKHNVYMTSRDSDLRRQRNGVLLHGGGIPPYAAGDSKARSYEASSV